MLYYIIICKKHLPERIVPLRVPFPGCACIQCACPNSDWKTLRVSNIWGSQWSECGNTFNLPTEYSLKNASFLLHPLWGTHLDDPAVTIAKVLPLCPSWTNGNVGHKHRSQATQLGQNLSHIDAYNGEEKVHTRKRHICVELDALKIIIIIIIIISFCTRSPQV